jgi:hypothetical protein
MPITLRREPFSDATSLKAFLDAQFPDGSSLRPGIDRGVMLSICVSNGDFQRIHFYSVCSEDRVVGAVILVREPSRIVFQVGRYKAPGLWVDRFRIAGERSLALDDMAAKPQDLEELFRALLREVGDRPLRLQWATRDGLLEKLSSIALASRTHIPDRTSTYRPWYWIDHFGSFDEYMAKLSSSSRQTFKYSVRRLRREMENEVRLVRFCAQSEIVEFLRDGREVSRNTYQWKELGFGLSDEVGANRRLGAAAELGQLCSYVLYLRDKPSAFIEGFRAPDLFIFYQIGYLPELGKLSVGTVAVLEVIRDLMESANPPRRIDFLSGDDGYKKRMGNKNGEERSHYLFPNAIQWRLVTLGLRACSLMTDVAWNVKHKLRKSSEEQKGKETGK